MWAIGLTRTITRWFLDQTSGPNILAKLVFLSKEHEIFENARKARAETYFFFNIFTKPICKLSFQKMSSKTKP